MGLVGSFEVKIKEMKLIFKFGKQKKLMVLNVHHDGFKPTNFLEWWSVVVYVIQRPMSTWWST